MPKIDPKTLEKARSAKGWSQARLAEECKIDKATVWRMEKGRTESVRPSVLKRLSEKLGLSDDVLTGNAEFPESEPDELLEPTQLNLRVERSAKNQLALVAMRYQVTQAQVVELAPFLFHCVAQQSLKSRKERHAQALAALKAAANLYEKLDHLPTDLASYQEQEAVLEAELSSIENEDIFGRYIEIQLEEDYTLPPGWADDTEGPFAPFLKGLAAEISDAEFSGWYDGPQYKVCESLAQKLVGGDERAASAIMLGNALLHELPSDLRKHGQEANRARWAHDKAAETCRKWEEKHPEFKGLSDLFGDKGEGR